MTSWRDSLSDAARGDLDRLLQSALASAKQELTRASEFTPFAVVVDLQGRVLAVDLDLSALGKHPETADIAAATASQLKLLADSTRCAALTTNTRLSAERTDAIEVSLEHREGVALLVLVPYKRPKFGGTTDYFDARTFAGTAAVWV